MVSACASTTTTLLAASCSPACCHSWWPCCPGSHLLSCSSTAFPVPHLCLTPDSCPASQLAFCPQAALPMLLLFPTPAPPATGLLSTVWLPCPVAALPGSYPVNHWSPFSPLVALPMLQIHSAPVMSASGRHFVLWLPCLHCSFVRLLLYSSWCHFASYHCPTGLPVLPPSSSTVKSHFRCYRRSIVFQQLASSYMSQQSLTSPVFGHLDLGHMSPPSTSSPQRNLQAGPTTSSGSLSSSSS